jgi:outer membrane protein OmpA-like peptidoglycan-associated protein
MKKVSLGLGLICAALFCGRASAVETYYAGGTKALPLQQAAGTARATGMGSAVAAVPQGSASLLWNPAGLSRMSCSEVGLHHNSGLGGIVQETAIFGMPLGKVKDCTDNCKGGSLGGLAASFGYVSYGSFEGRDELGLEVGSYHAGDFSGSLGWGLELLPGFSGGIVLKGNQSTFGGTSYNAYTTDAGVLWTVIPALDLGLTYSNLNLGKTVGGKELASGLRLGAAWSVDKHLIFSVAGELQDQAMNRLQIGTEYLIGKLEDKVNVLALRAGYQANYPDPKLTGLTGLTLGLGYTLTTSLALDYAMVPTGELGTSHKLSLTLKFDCPKKPAPPVAAAPAPKPVVVAAAPPVIVVRDAPKPVVLREFEFEERHFDFDSSKIRPAGKEALKENVQFLKENPKAMVLVEGYTSIRGTEEYNQKLSEKRAKRVADFMIAEGIAPDRVSSIGYGELRPSLYQESAGKKGMNSDAAKANRRVVIKVIEK